MTQYTRSVHNPLPSEVVFIDPHVSHLPQLVAALRPEVEPILLEADRPAPAQMATALAGRAGLEVIHIIAHGLPGQVSFAAGALTAAQIADGEGAELAALGHALAPNGQLLLWSCETGQGIDGRAFVASLAQAAGTQVAAAAGRIGAAAQGGCWELDVGENGRIDACPLTINGMEAYPGVMDPTIVIDVIAGDDIVGATEAAAAGTIAGTSTAEDGQLVTIEIRDASDALVHTGTAMVSAGQWSLAVDATTLGSLADGSYMVLADVTDVGGTPAIQATRSFAVDTTAPTVTVQSVYGDSSTTVAIRGSVDAAHAGLNVTVFANGTPLATVTPDPITGVWILPAQAFAVAGDYVLTASATDAAGNIGTSAELAIDVHIGAAGFDSFSGDDGPDVYFGQNGIARIDYSNDTAGVVVDLAAGTAQGSSIGQDALVSIEQVRTGSGNDHVVTGPNGAGVYAGLGNDTITGDAAADDAAFFAGSLTDYQINPTTSAINIDAHTVLIVGGAAVTVTGPDGEDTLTGIDILTFNAPPEVVDQNKIAVDAVGDDAGTVVATGSLLAGASDDDGDTFAVVHVDGVLPNGDGDIVIATAYGTLSVVATTGAFTFTANAGFDALAPGETQQLVYSFGVTDSYGENGTVEKTLTINLQGGHDAPPAIPVIAGFTDDSGTIGDHITKDSDLLLSGTADPGAEVRLLDGATQIGTVIADANGQWSAQTGALTEGTHNFTAYAVRGSDISATSAAVTVTVDSIAPAAPGVALAEDTGASSSDGVTSNAALTLTGVEADATVQYSTDNGATWASSFASEQGPNTVLVRQIDVAGNISDGTSHTFFFDDVGPVAPSTPDLDAASDTGTLNDDNLTSDNTPSFSGTATAGTKIRLYANGTEVASTTADGFGNWTIDAATLADGAHAITATATDAAGNESAASAALSITIDSADHAPTGDVSIDDTTPTQAQLLTAVNTINDIDGVGAFQYQWQSSSDGMAWDDIGGATGQTFSPTATEIGRQLRVIASYTDGGGTFNTRTSAPTAAVAANVAPDDITIIGGGSLQVSENGANGTLVGTVLGHDVDSVTLTYALTNDASGRFAINSAGAITVANSALLDYEQSASHTISVQVTDDSGNAFIETFDVTVNQQRAEASIANQAAQRNTSLALNAVLNLSGDGVVQYQLYDGGALATSAYFSTPQNAHHPANSYITVDADDIDETFIRSGSSAGSETLWVRAFDGTDWGAWDAFTFTTLPNNAPQAVIANQSLQANKWAKVDNWLSAVDADGDTITQYQFYDAGAAANSGYFWTPQNAHHAAHTYITVQAADIDSTWIRGGQSGGSETMWVRAFDGTDWGAWDAFTLTTLPNNAPQATISDQSLKVNKWAKVDNWLSTVDADGDTITQYQFYDAGAGANSAHFWTPQNANHAAHTYITVAAADIGSTWLQGGQAAGSETMWVRAFDGTDWGAWDAFTLTTLPNAAPQVGIADHTLAVNQWSKVDSWVSATDADGDAITQYQFYDAGAGASTGYFWTPQNAHHAADTYITVAAADIGSTWVRGGASAGSELMWVRGFDGTDWSAWDAFYLTTA